MAHLRIPYGKSELTLDIDSSRLNAVIQAQHSSGDEQDAGRIVRNSLDKPVCGPRLRELAAGKKNICVITSDHTRPMPSKITLPLLLKEIRAGNPEADISILIATGMHRSPTPAEMENRFGAEMLAREHFVIHDSRDDSAMCSLGVLPSGGELLINRIAVECDLLVSEGFIEPHFFAGFSGGRKSVLPGVASYKTVMHNHNSAFIAHQNASQGILAENPIHEDMAFAAEKAHLAFILNVLLDEKQRIVHAFAGFPAEAHAAGCNCCKNEACVSSIPADIVITSNGGAPLVQNLYQSVKGMTAAEKCINPGGIIIMCAECADGHGGENFINWFAQRQSALEVLEDIKKIPAKNTVPDQWQAQILARVLTKAECIFVTEEKNKALVETLFMTWAPDLATALETAEKRIGFNASITSIPNGVNVIIE